jgi:hypothetical protein
MKINYFLWIGRKSSWSEIARAIVRGKEWFIISTTHGIKLNPEFIYTAMRKLN